MTWTTVMQVSLALILIHLCTDSAMHSHTRYRNRATHSSYTRPFSDFVSIRIQPTIGPSIVHFFTSSIHPYLHDRPDLSLCAEESKDDVTRTALLKEFPLTDVGRHTLAHTLKCIADGGGVDGDDEEDEAHGQSDTTRAGYVQASQLTCMLVTQMILMRDYAITHPPEEPRNDDEVSPLWPQKMRDVFTHTLLQGGSIRVRRCVPLFHRGG